MPYNAISLFSGAMGLDLGIERAGFKIRACVEFDKWAAETIRTNTDIPVINSDINKVSSEEILAAAKLRREDVTLVVGGPPCQAFSTAGRQRGLADFRGNVILQFLRVVTDIRPEYFLLENVRGILSSKLNTVPVEYKEYENIKDIKGSVLEFITSQFKKLGYSISYALLDAANYGVPERRERVVIIGHIGERVPIPSPTHSKGGIHGTHPWVTLRDAIGDLELRQNLHYIPLRAKSMEYMRLLTEGQNWRHLPPKLAEQAMGKAYYLSGGKTGFLRRLRFDEPSPTLVTSPTMPATLLCHPTQLRPLSIEEYARIQQFPDTWKFSGRIETIYKQIGNAVPVGLGYAVGRQIMKSIHGELRLNEEAFNRIPYSRYSNSMDDEALRLFEPEADYSKKSHNMNKTINRVEEYVKEHISEFHNSRIEKLQSLKMDGILKKKNPYLFKAKYLESAPELVRNLVEAVMSSSEETLFGDWLEQLAIYIASDIFGGRKSAVEGVDLEMDKDGVHYLVSIKSGPNWSNSSSMKKQEDHFKKAKQVYRTGKNKVLCEAVIGCCYGKKKKIDDVKTIICGQRFWQFISGSETLYTDIIEPLGTDAKVKNEAYTREYNKLLTRLTHDFISKYCKPDGEVNWDLITQLNAGTPKPKKNKESKKNSD